MRIIDVLGDFTVFEDCGRNYLYFKTDKIGECINGDYKERWSSVSNWLKYIKTRCNTRIRKIEETRAGLEAEEHTINKILVGISEVKL